MEKSWEIEPEMFRILERQFKEHLLQEGNRRTIFSGKFGSGKTTFLRHFFKKEDANFVRITLHPVNYSIASNEDIFSYIKYDLLLELLTHVDLSQLKDFDLGLPEKAYLYWHDQPLEIIEKTSSIIGALGKLLHPSLDMFEKLAGLYGVLKKGMDAHYEEASKKLNEHQVAVEFIDKIREKSGSLYEETVLTRLIEKMAEIVKSPKSEGEAPGKIIVLIEDTDRIDPEHIFRILNVFSAHFDNKQVFGENSFGVDTLVVVCDEDNIRNIFSNRYGSNVDYSGYVDKFYSCSIFQFNYAELAHDYIRKLVVSLEVRFVDGRRMADSVINTITSDSFLTYLLTLLWDHKYITLRSIIRVLGTPIRYNAIDIRLAKHPLSLNSYLIILELLIIIEICDNIESLRKHIQKLSSINEPYNTRGKVFERLSAFLVAVSGNISTDGKSLVKAGTFDISGIIQEGDEGQICVEGLLVAGTHGSIGIPDIRTIHLFECLLVVLQSIERLPRLRLNSYYLE